MVVISFSKANLHGVNGHSEVVLPVTVNGHYNSYFKIFIAFSLNMLLLIDMLDKNKLNSEQLSTFPSNLPSLSSP
jgi:hypothetical protein